MSKPLKTDLREARKHKTIREMTFAMRGNTKPFGKRLSASAETSNYSGNELRHARKCQTIRETTFVKRGNSKPFGKQLSPSAEMPNHSGRDFRQARERQTFCWEIFRRPIRDINKKSVHLIAQMNALIKRRRLPTLPHCIAVPSAQVGLTSLFGMGRGGTPPQ